MSHMSNKDIQERNEEFMRESPLVGKPITLTGQEYDDLIYALGVALNRVKTLIRESKKPDVSGIYLGPLSRREKTLKGIKERLMHIEASRNPYEGGGS